MGKYFKRPNKHLEVNNIYEMNIQQMRLMSELTVKKKTVLNSINHSKLQSKKRPNPVNRMSDLLSNFKLSNKHTEFEERNDETEKNV